ncbi:hypothetical protein H0A65_00685 [Alcaligenaceae bacterium]|nr:hypothetical protein [Alcaligenaceae bacterium]
MSQEKIRSEKTDQGPWWREPWPWIIMAGPFLAIVGCIITIVLAFQNTGNQAITDGGVKRGLVVTQQEQAPEPQK